MDGADANGKQNGVAARKPLSKLSSQSSVTSLISVGSPLSCRCHIFEFLAVVNFYKNRDLKVLERKTLLNYPEIHDPTEKLQALGFLCFPENQLDQTPFSPDTCYTGQMCDHEKGPLVVYCRRLICPEMPDDYLCICIESQLHDHSLYSNILRYLEGMFLECVSKSRNLDNFVKKVVQFAQILYKQPIPFPGEYCTFHLKSMDEIKIYREEDTSTSVPKTNLSVLVTLISLPQLLSIFAALLFERRVIVVASDLSLLTNLCYSFIEILYPLQWQHVMIPLLHKNEIERCRSTEPYLIGVQSSLLGQVRKLGLQEVHILDLNKESLEETAVLYENFPRLPFQTMCFGLSKLITKSKKHLKVNDAEVRSVFLDFFVNVFGPYRKHIRASKEYGVRLFDINGFIQHSELMRPFLEMMSATKSFRKFVKSKEDILAARDTPPCKEDAFERAVSALSLYPPLIERKETTIFTSLRERFKNMSFSRISVDKPAEQDLDVSMGISMDKFSSSKQSKRSLARLSHTTSFLHLHVSFAPPIHAVPELRETTTGTSSPQSQSQETIIPSNGDGPRSSRSGNLSSPSLLTSASIRILGCNISHGALQRASYQISPSQSPFR
eukprot:TRINITY_DN2719_c0_g1_i6.p1 TRINITY_DN2719_c0_g1~~TRINITY_DN2719_c0_g1_i6.p1  ORF type:complete len:610 (+),score=100.28 TRINITY_DN2719_c0_g1_i6:45-1874(+)